MEVVGTAADGDAAVELIARIRPDVVTLDVQMPGRDGIEVLRALKQRGLSPRSIMVSSLTAQGAPTTVAALMEGAAMNYVNDSAPLHIASAMNAPVTAVFCSTVPAFGFGPLRENGRVVETTEKLDCRPCGLHGHRACPKGHFRCALGIGVEQVVA